MGREAARVIGVPATATRAQVRRATDGQDERRGTRSRRHPNARLAPTASHAFRIDVARGLEPAESVLGRLAGLSADPAFVGYPYPLARAHQAARVTGYDVADVRRDFRDALSRRGMSEEDVEVLFQDFHEVLNR